MKTLKTITLMMLTSIALSITSCSSDDNGNGTTPSGGTGGGEFLTAKLDGANWSASTNYDLIVVAHQPANNLLTIQAGNDTGESIRATLTNYTGIGTYTTGDNINNTNSLTYTTVSPIASWSSTFDIGSGTIEITSDNGSIIEGTFLFDGWKDNNSPLLIVTDGAFRGNVE